MRRSKSSEGFGPRDRTVTLFRAGAVVVCLPALILPGQFPLWAEVGSLIGLALISFTPFPAWRRRLPRTPVDLPISILLLLLPLNLLISADRGLTLPHVYKIVAGASLFYAVVDLLTQTGWFTLSTWGICLVGLALVPTVLYGTAWGGGKMSWLLWDVGSHFPRLFQPFWKPEGYSGFNPNMTGGTLAMLLPVPIAVTLFAQDLRCRLLGGVDVLLMAATLLLTQSRGALLSVLVGALAMLATRSWRWVIIITVVIAGGALILQQAGMATISLSPNLESDVESVVNSAEGRVELWSRAWYMMQDFAFTGIGMGMVAKVMPLLYPTFLIPPTADIEHLHSLYLNTGAEIGFPGLIVLLALLIGLLALSWHAAQQAPQSPLEPLVIGLFGVQIALCAHGLVDAVTFSPYVHLIAWSLFGIAVAADIHTLHSNGG